MEIKVVIDTNVLVASLSSKSDYHWLIRLLLEEKIRLYVTEEIMLEYDEILKQKYSDTVATNFLNALKELPNVHYKQVFFRWNLLNDPDDNKFADCYMVAGAQYLITHDKDFNVLKSIPFPRINVMSLIDFEKVIS